MGLGCCSGFSLVAACRGLSPFMMHRLLPAVASLVGEHGLWGCRLWHVGSAVVVPGLESTGSVAVVHGLVAPRHVGSPRIRDQTCISCTGKWILYP